MLAANSNCYSPNLQIAAWKMLRAGVPLRVISSTLGLTPSIWRVQGVGYDRSSIAFDGGLAPLDSGLQWSVTVAISFHAALFASTDREARY